MNRLNVLNIRVKNALQTIMVHVQNAKVDFNLLMELVPALIIDVLFAPQAL
jgi:hypothetical protein